MPFRALNAFAAFDTLIAMNTNAISHTGTVRIIANGMRLTRMRKKSNTMSPMPRPMLPT